MRNGNKWTTAKLLSAALASKKGYAEFAPGETTVAVSIGNDGVVSWEVNGRRVTEEDAADVLVRWAVEGV